MTLTDKDMTGLAYLIQGAKEQAWEKAIDAAYEHYLTEEQRDHLLTLNPYKETSA